MKISWTLGLLAIAASLPLALTAAKNPFAQENPAGQGSSAGQKNSPGQVKLRLQDKRTSPTDLALSGDLPGASAYSGRFVTYDELRKLPQVTVTVTDDGNFKRKVELSGIYLDELMRALDIPEKNTLVAAICDDAYEGHYTVEYRAAHHPILVLAIGGKPLGLSRRTADDGAYGPYLISHPSFDSRYRILAHSEEAQIPNGVLEVRFLSEDKVLSAIHPQGEFAPGSLQMEGYQIARENCFRCHNAGAYGGRKAAVSWSSLAKMAATKPGYFTAYTRDPQSESAYAQMPGFPDYDDATLAALIAYFQAAPGGQSKDQGSK
jgi:hypothetical protein